MILKNNVFPYIIMLNIDAFIEQFCLANIYFLIIDVDNHVTDITKNKWKHAS